MPATPTRNATSTSAYPWLNTTNVPVATPRPANPAPAATSGQITPQTATMSGSSGGRAPAVTPGAVSSSMGIYSPGMTMPSNPGAASASLIGQVAPRGVGNQSNPSLEGPWWKSYYGHGNALGNSQGGGSWSGSYYGRRNALGGGQDVGTGQSVGVGMTMDGGPLPGGGTSRVPPPPMPSAPRATPPTKPLAAVTGQIQNPSSGGGMMSGGFGNAPAPKPTSMNPQQAIRSFGSQQPRPAGGGMMGGNTNLQSFLGSFQNRAPGQMGGGMTPPPQAPQRPAPPTGSAPSMPGAPAQKSGMTQNGPPTGGVNMMSNFQAPKPAPPTPPNNGSGVNPMPNMGGYTSGAGPNTSLEPDRPGSFTSALAQTQGPISMTPLGYPMNPTPATASTAPVSAQGAIQNYLGSMPQPAAQEPRAAAPRPTSPTQQGSTLPNMMTNFQQPAGPTSSQQAITDYTNQQNRQTGGVDPMPSNMGQYGLPLQTGPGGALRPEPARLPPTPPPNLGNGFGNPTDNSGSGLSPRGPGNPDDNNRSQITGYGSPPNPGAEDGSGDTRPPIAPGLPERPPMDDPRYQAPAPPSPQNPYMTPGSDPNQLAHRPLGGPGPNQTPLGTNVSDPNGTSGAPPPYHVGNDSSPQVQSYTVDLANQVRNGAPGAQAAYMRMMQAPNTQAAIDAYNSFYAQGPQQSSGGGTGAAEAQAAFAANPFANYQMPGQGGDVGVGSEWSMPGSPAPEGQWGYDLGGASTGGGGWSQPDGQMSQGSTQIGLGADFDPTSRGQEPEVQVHGPGEQAPPHMLNWEPESGIAYPPGQVAPVDRTQYSLQAA